MYGTSTCKKRPEFRGFSTLYKKLVYLSESTAVAPKLEHQPADTDLVQLLRQLCHLRKKSQN